MGGYGPARSLSDDGLSSFVLGDSLGQRDSRRLVRVAYRFDKAREVAGGSFQFRDCAPKQRRMQTIWHMHTGFWATRIAARLRFTQESDAGNS